MISRCAWVVVVLLVVAARPARAEGLITPFIGFSFGGDAAHCLSLTNCEERRVNWGLSMASVRGVFGFEEDIGYAPQFFGETPGGDSGVLTVMSSFMLIIPSGPIRPFALVGIGFLRPHARLDATSLSAEGNSIAYNVGGGVNVFFAPHLGLRGEVRHILTMKDVTLGVFSVEQLELWRASVGLALKF